MNRATAAQIATIRRLRRSKPTKNPSDQQRRDRDAEAATISGPATADVAKAATAMAARSRAARPSQAGLRRQSTLPRRSRAHQREAAERRARRSRPPGTRPPRRSSGRGRPPATGRRPCRRRSPRARSPACRRRARSRSGAGPAAGARTGCPGGTRRRRRQPPRFAMIAAPMAVDPALAEDRPDLRGRQPPDRGGPDRERGRQVGQRSPARGSSHRAAATPGDAREQDPGMPSVGARSANACSRPASTAVHAASARSASAIGARTSGDGIRRAGAGRVRGRRSAGIADVTARSRGRSDQPLGGAPVGRPGRPAGR